jgi:predicted dehydrogenase
MRALVGGRWDDGFLDEWAGPGACRIRVEAWVSLCHIDDAYFVQPRDWRRVWNYVREIGPVAVARKIASRQKEAGRNQKFLGAGLGRVLSGPYPIDTAVVFLAPMHPAASERVVIDTRLVSLADERPVFAKVARDAMAPGAIAHAALAGMSQVPAAWDVLAGWQSASALPLDAAVVTEAWDSVDHAVSAKPLTWQRCPTSPVQERREAATSSGPRRTALFGYGQYAKTVILPNLDRGLSVVAVHEVDPIQLRTVDLAGVTCDTSPWPREADRYDVYFAAGYHHTHAPIAEHALRQGAVAIVEKPPVTTREQLDSLLAAWASGGQLHVCFQRRYSDFSAFAKQDLRASGGPISYRCLVYEVRLPRRHWYRWPASRGRVVSNGCHWIDHFLFMNDYAPVRRYDAWRASNGDAVCTAELANGAAFAMHLTDQGSSRIGMQNTIEMRTEDVTVTTVNDAMYLAEDRRRLIRRASQNKMAAFTAMYRTISAKAAAGQTTDTPAALEASAGLMLALDELLEGPR